MERRSPSVVVALAVVTCAAAGCLVALTIFPELGIAEASGRCAVLGALMGLARVRRDRHLKRAAADSRTST